VCVRGCMHPHPHATSPTPYEQDVRVLLQGLDTDLRAGVFHVTQNAEGRSLAVGAPGYGGRNVIVPPNIPNPSTNQPRRSLANAFSNMYVKTRDGRRIYVSKRAILRNQHVLVRADEAVGACRGCLYGTCPHNWPRLGASSIVVVDLSSARTAQPAWFVRFDDAPLELVRVPTVLIGITRATISRDPDLQGSRLVGPLADVFESSTPCSSDATQTPTEIACKQLETFAEVALAAARRDRKRRRERRRVDTTATTTSTDDLFLDTCAICLDEKASAQKRCRGSTCSVSVCNDCHADARGLCPVCDRAAINGSYWCSACCTKVSLLQYGFACASCESTALCLTCSADFKWCGPCGGVAALA
jgi:hypothetical protein